MTANQEKANSGDMTANQGQANFCPLCFGPYIAPGLPEEEDPGRG